MLLLLLVCLMKIVDMAAINKHRKCCGGGLDSKENCAQNGQYQYKSTSSLLQNLNMKNQKYLNSQQYEQQLRLFQQHQRYQLYQQHQQQQQQRQQQQYEQILLYQKHLQQQKHKENQLLKQKQQQLHEKQQLNQQQKQRMQYHNNYIKNKQSQDRVNLLFSKLCNSSYYNFEKGNEPLCGMTEYPINEKQKSRQSQLNHNSSPHHYHNTTNTYYHHQHPTNYYIAHQQKRPLTTSPNNTIPYNYGISNFNYQSSPTSAYGDYQIDNDKSFDNTNINSIYDDELTEETLKRNVQIVLNNLDRYNNALRSIILNDQTNFINYNNNSCSNSSNNSILTTTATAAAMANILSSPESDYNSNATSHHPFGGHLNLNLNCSVASSHDFTHDNSDYQWFLDYGYRDGGFTHQSVLSSLSASYNGIGELSYYEDLAKNIDANLAEVDMESFCAEDIHSLLTQLPSLGGCNKDSKRNNRDDQNDIDNSICKSELLFSPVKESHISIDSLDLESYPDDGDIILTCKANKDNYTIAFEGSTLYSDESFYAEPVDPNAGKNKQNFINLHSNLDDIVKRKSLEVSMSRSDHAFTTWSKLKKGSSSQLQRYPSGNNNTSVNIVTRHSPHCIVRKSSSLPNLRLKKESDRQLNVSQAVSNSTVDSFKSRNLLPMCQMPVSSTSGSESPVHTSSNMHSTDNSSSKQHNNQPSFNLVKLFIKQKSNSSDTCMDISSGCWPSDASSSSEQQKVIRCGGRKNLNDSGKGSAALSRHDEENVDVNNDSSYQLDSLDICDQQKNNEMTVTNTNKDTTNVTIRKAKNDLYREVFETQTQQRNYMNTKDCSNSHINTTTTTTTTTTTAAAAATRNHHQPLKNPQIYNLTVQNSLNNNNNSINNNNLNNNNNNNSMERDSLSRDLTNKSISDASRTSDNLTQIFYNNSNNRMKIPAEMITRSMQTSNLGKDRLRFVPPSFLAKLNTLGEEKKAPVYVIYPNYALPDLGFVKNNISDVILSPFNYKNAIASKRRPTSFTGNDEEAIKQIDYKHIADWKSLVTLLPVEYRKRLTHIPEADVELDPECSQKPLFCMTPPLRRNKTSLCDCATYLQQTCTTSSSGSSQQPSSGYRGSSTLLTDSEVEGNIRNDNNSSEQGIRNVQPYQQFDCNRIETDSIVDRPPPSGRTPRSILRRNLKTATRTKRNSMFEEDNVRSKNVEKRRSLQEPYYAPEDFGDVEDYLAELEDNRVRQYYQDLRNVTVNNVKQKSDINFTTDLNAIDKKIRKEHDIEARIRAENFLSSVPKSELKYYAEIANILEAADNYTLPEYDPAKLKNEVSRALCQKKVSFNNGGQMHYLNSGVGGGGGLPHKFSTPPNSPNISMAALRMTNNTTHHQHQHRLNEKKELSAADKEKQEKISSNRFKRLQIQWELLSTDSSMMLKDLAREKETKSGGSTPTSANAAQRSRIPRPVSYPASKTTVAQEQQNGKNIRSPSRIVPPKKYSVPPLPNTATTGITSPNSGGGGVTSANTTQITAINNPSSQITRPRTPNRPNTTPKKRIPSPRPATRTR